MSCTYPVGASLEFRLSSVKAVVYKLYVNHFGEDFECSKNNGWPVLPLQCRSFALLKHAYLPQNSRTPAVAKEPTSIGCLSQDTGCQFGLLTPAYR